VGIIIIESQSLLDRALMTHVTKANEALLNRSVLAKTNAE